jgi:ParB family chromosome partitioning protein
MTTLTGKLIRVDQIDVPPGYERKSTLMEDDAVKRSIEKTGIQQPLSVVALPSGRYGLIKGGRRLAIAQSLGLKTVPAVIDQLPPDTEPSAFQNRLRFILDEHRQDLFPSQRAALIRQLMSMFKMMQKDVAEYLGVDAGSVTNWMRIEDYHPEIVKAIDTGEITLHAARAFDRMKQESQPKVFKAIAAGVCGVTGKEAEGGCAIAVRERVR